MSVAISFYIGRRRLSRSVAKIAKISLVCLSRSNESLGLVPCELRRQPPRKESLKSLRIAGCCML